MRHSGGVGTPACDSTVPLASAAASLPRPTLAVVDYAAARVSIQQAGNIIGDRNTNVQIVGSGNRVGNG